MPTHLGHYEVRAKIAEGGMATIYLGVDQKEKHRRVALKVIKRKFSANPEFVAMFLDEAKLIERIDHQNVVKLYELGADQGRLFLSMELLIGQSLWTVWEACRDRDVRLKYEQIAWMGARIAEGLHNAHQTKDEKGEALRIVHRDVNATNVIVTYDGEVKVIDFGLAKGNNRISRTAAGIVKGKLAYLAPEQTVTGELDHRTDIFALGTTLWELATDRRLFKRPDDADTLRAVHEAEIPDPTTIFEDFPPELWRILKKALARDREDRHATIGDLARELDAFAEGADCASPASVARVMEVLFADDRRRQVSWVAEASESNTALKTLHPGEFNFTLAPRGDRETPLGLAIPRPGLVPSFDILSEGLFLPAGPDASNRLAKPTRSDNPKDTMIRRAADLDLSETVPDSSRLPLVPREARAMDLVSENVSLAAPKIEFIDDTAPSVQRNSLSGGAVARPDSASSTRPVWPWVVLLLAIAIGVLLTRRP